VALAHKILVIVYTLFKTGEQYQERGATALDERQKDEQYQERGATALDERQKDRLLQRLQRRIAQLGYSVSLEPLDATAA
jgi:hypothetical protein